MNTPSDVLSRIADKMYHVRHPEKWTHVQDILAECNCTGGGTVFVQNVFEHICIGLDAAFSSPTISHWHAIVLAVSVSYLARAAVRWFLCMESVDQTKSRTWCDNIGKLT